MTATLTVRCGNCPNPANCSPTFCHFEEAEVETPHDKAARRFYDPGQPLHIEACEGPGRLARVLDWVGNSVSHIAGFGRAVKEGFFNAFRDAWALLPSALFAFGIVLACWLAVWLPVCLWGC